MLFWIKILAGLPIKYSHFEKYRLKQNKVYEECKYVQMCENTGGVSAEQRLEFSAADRSPQIQELCCPLLGRDEKVAQASCPLSVPPVTDAGEVYDRYCPRDGVPQQQELHPPRPRSP